MKSILTSLLIVASSAVVGYAEIAPKSPEKLKQNATHIALGSVTAIYTHTWEDKKFLHTRGVVEIRVSKLEKGDSIQPGKAIYARFWTQRWNEKAGRPQPYGSGHKLPKPGETVRVYLETKEGGYNAIVPNGFEVQPSAKQQEK